MNDKLLRKLAQKEQHRYGDLKEPNKDQALAELAAAELVEETKVGRSRMFALTPAGRAAVEALPVLEAPRPAARAPRAAAAAVTDERLARIEAALVRIESAIARLAAPAAVPAALKPAILEAVQALDDERRFGGLVPIPELRRALRARGLTAPDAQVNAALVELEAEFVIDLSIAQSPTTVHERGAGIERPNGLAYYVVRRRG